MKRYPRGLAWAIVASALLIAPAVTLADRVNTGEEPCEEPCGEERAEPLVGVTKDTLHETTDCNLNPDPPGQGTTAALNECADNIQNGPDGFAATADADGIEISHPSGGPVDCIGFWEDAPELTEMSIEIAGNQTVAQIYKVHNFTNSIGPPSGTFTVKLNEYNFRVTLVSGMSEFDVQTAMLSKMRTRFTVEDYLDYWIVTRETLSDQYIESVGLEVPSSMAMTWVELRHETTDHTTGYKVCGGIANP